MYEKSKHTKRSASLKAIILFLGLVGCAPDQISNPNFVAFTNFTPSKNLTIQTAASIVGSQDTSPNPLSADATIYLTSVDNNPVTNGWRSWNIPVLVTPGEHYIEFSECVCSLFVSPWAGNIDVEVVLKAGQTYTLKATPPVQSHIFGPTTSDGWVVDESGKLVSKVVDDSGTLVSEKYHFSLNPQTGGPDTIPIFLPTK
jgi:hypothetical protein